ncbi:MAG: hypothetical protein ACI9OJ_001909, partial [Myxococcota bacterium]
MANGPTEQDAESIEGIRAWSPPVLTEVPVQMASQEDTLWLVYFLGGDIAILRRIVNLLPRRQGGMPGLLVGGAAFWSLSSNAGQHVQIWKHTVALVASSRDPLERSELSDVILAAQQQRSGVAPPDPTLLKDAMTSGQPIAFAMIKSSTGLNIGKDGELAKISPLA